MLGHSAYVSLHDIIYGLEGLVQGPVVLDSAWIAVCNTQGQLLHPNCSGSSGSNLFGFSAKYLSTVSSVVSELDESPKDNRELMVCVLICTSISQFV